MLKTFQLMKPSPENATVEHGGRNFMSLRRRYPMADRQALIDWPLTPIRWGGYGIQLAQALLEQRLYSPRLLACNDRSAFCDLHWLMRCSILKISLQHWRNDWLLLKEPTPFQSSPRQPWLSPHGNYVPAPRFTAAGHVGVTFFECSRFHRRILRFSSNLIW